MKNTIPEPLLPAEEVTLLLNAVEEALILAHRREPGGAQAGHDRLIAGRKQGEQWQGESWGPALLALWDRSVTHYEGRFLL